jgi:hypothetical protein
VITQNQERIYLGAMHARGSGNVRGSEVANVEPSIVDNELIVKMTHSHYGAMEVNFIGMSIDYAYPARGYDTDEAREANLTDDAMRIIQYGTWEIDIDKKSLSAMNENVFGYSRARISFSDMTVTIQDNIPEDGQCRACGSEEFILKSFGTQRLKSVGPHNFEATSPATLSIINSSPRITCASCNTEHASSGTFNGGFVIDGRSNRREDRKFADSTIAGEDL